MLFYKPGISKIVFLRSCPRVSDSARNDPEDVFDRNLGLEADGVEGAGLAADATGDLAHRTEFRPAHTLGG